MAIQSPALPSAPPLLAHSAGAQQSVRRDPVGQGEAAKAETVKSRPQLVEEGRLVELQWLI